jgi:hypothetical protein
MAKTIATILGIFFLVVGLLGFAAPGMMGMHLSLAHNIVHLVSGALALYFGARGTYDAARAFCIIFGIVYGLLGLIGFVAGAGSDYMLNLVPNQLVLGKMDHIIHVILGVVFILAGFSTHVVTTTAPADRTY